MKRTAAESVNRTGVLASLSEYAYTSLRSRLLHRELPVDEPLREAQLVRELGISRTPIREALRRLQAEGMVQPIPHGGFMVVEWDPAELKQVYAVRIALERLAVRSAATERSRMDLAEMADRLDDCRVATDGNQDDLPTFNRAFHSVIAKASHNTYLLGELTSIAEIIHRYPVAEATLAARARPALDEHEELLEAITASDADAADRVMQLHLERGMGSLLQTYRDPEDPSTSGRSVVGAGVSADGRPGVAAGNATERTIKAG